MGSPLNYDRDAVARDLLLLATVPLALVAVHVLGTPSLRARLALDHADPAYAEFLTAAYVHATDVHLRNNVLSFVAGSLMAYLLCLRAGRRRWFHATTVALLLVVPVVVNVGSYLTLDAWYVGPPPTTRGFSGVVSATGGFVFVALLVWLAARYSRATVTFVGALVVLALSTTLYALHADAVDPLVVGPLAISAALCLLALAVAGSVPLRSDPAVARSIAVQAVPIVLVAILLVTFVVGLFPTRIVRDGMVVNVYAHGGGFLLGGCIAGALEPLVGE
jgi:hypothetical protein